MPNGSKIIRGLQLLEQLNDGEELDISYDDGYDRLQVFGYNLPERSEAVEALGWYRIRNLWQVEL